MKKIAMLAAAATLLLGACATAPTVSKDDAMSAISMAKQETAKAKKVNYEWRDTGKIIKKAEEAPPLNRGVSYDHLHRPDRPVLASVLCAEAGITSLYDLVYVASGLLGLLLRLQVLYGHLE